MATKNPVALLAGIALLVVTAVPAAPGQTRQEPPTPGTERPGQSTKAQVWVENRGRNEAIPIVATAPIPVVVQNPVRQWEYQTVSVAPGTSPTELTRLLTVQGNAGWYRRCQVMSGLNTLLVMKRPIRTGAGHEGSGTLNLTRSARAMSSCRFC